MALQPLFCVAEDRHRAVLLTGALSDLGIPVEQVSEPGQPRQQPALVLWTRRAAEAPWLARVFENYPDTVALILDDVALPAACTRSLPLQSWPARSADASIGALARWLKNPDRTRAPFDKRMADAGARRSRADDASGPIRRSAGGSPGQDRSRQVAFGIIGACLLLLLVVLITDSEPVTEADNPDGALVADNAAVPDLAASRTAAESQVRQRASGKTSRAGGSLQRTAAGSDKPGTLLTEPVAESTADSEAAQATSIERASGKSTAGDDSLSHLCRARSLAAALAWYRVLTPAQQRLAPELDCVQALLDRPGFAALEEAFQA